MEREFIFSLDAYELFLHIFLYDKKKCLMTEGFHEAWIGQGVHDSHKRNKVIRLCIKYIYVSLLI